MSAILRDLRAAFGDVEPAPYSVVVQRAGYEERVYPGRRWACTSMHGSSRDALITPMFRRLFCYISGRNEPNIRIDMTTPVLTLVKKGKEGGKMDDENKEEIKEEEINTNSNGSLPSSSSFTYTMGFLIPAAHQENPPASSDQNIFIEERPDITVFVRRFSGFMNDSIVEREKEILFKSIRENGEDEGVDFSQYYVAQFDPPFKLLGRRNELWVRKHIPPNTVSGCDGDGGGVLMSDKDREEDLLKQVSIAVNVDDGDGDLVVNAKRDKEEELEEEEDKAVKKY